MPVASSFSWSCPFSIASSHALLVLSSSPHFLCVQYIMTHWHMVCWNGLDLVRSRTTTGLVLKIGNVESWNWFFLNGSGSRWGSFCIRSILTFASFVSTDSKWILCKQHEHFSQSPCSNNTIVLLTKFKICSSRVGCFGQVMACWRFFFDVVMPI